VNRHVSRIFLCPAFSSTAVTFLFSYPHFSGCIRVLRSRYASPMASNEDLALHQRFLVQEQTLMGWIRTCASFITFGFGFYKFFEYLNEGDETSISNSLFGPPEFALAVIAVGCHHTCNRRPPLQTQSRFTAKRIGRNLQITGGDHRKFCHGSRLGPSHCRALS